MPRNRIEDRRVEPGGGGVRMGVDRGHQSAAGVASRPRRALLVVVGVAATLVLAACGGSDGNSSTSTTLKGGTTTVKGGTSAAATTAAATTVVTTIATTVATTSPATTTGYSAEPTTGALKKGMKGNRVAAMQTKLRSLGYDPGPADGLFGDKTDAAVRKFQTDKKLAVDGVAGTQTLSALDTACSAKGGC